MIHLLLKKTNSNAFIVSSNIFKFWQVKFTESKLNQLLEEHTEYPSLLSVKDTLLVYGIESVAVFKGDNTYSDFETPYIAVIQEEGWAQPMLTLVTEVQDSKIVYIDPLNGIIESSDILEFESKDKGIILLLDERSKKNEKDYLSNLKEEKRGKLSSKIALFLTLFLLGIYQIFNIQNNSWLQNIFLITSIIGLVTSVLLIWYEIDSYNPLIREMCGGRSKILNCNVVLNSAGAKFLGFSWSIWGFIYFSTFFLSIVIFLPQSNYLLFWSVISLIVSPYILYSLFYQWKIIKRWCPLCLLIQLLLLINVITVTLNFGLLKSFIFEWYEIFSLFFVAYLISLSTIFVFPKLKQAKTSKTFEKELKRLRYNPLIFKSLLEKQTKILKPVENLGILLGNPNAKNEIVKVCNPYCRPCSKAHIELETLLRSSSDYKVRIIFTASGEEKDIKTLPVAHLLAIQETSDENTIQMAIDEWYTSPIKDYEKFRIKYPMYNDLSEQKNKIKGMKVWCDEMKIKSTPTIFINGCELPDGYRVDDLKNILL